MLKETAFAANQTYDAEHCPTSKDANLAPTLWNQLLLLFEYDPQMLISGSHNPWLVSLSVVVAIVASIIAMQLAGVAQNSSQATPRKLAIATGSFALGAGVWAMHFIGMLAFELCTSVQYSPWITLVSMVPSLLAAYLALRVLSGKSRTWTHIGLGGALIGAGIGVMHYSGMAAMQMAPELHYDLVGFAISIVVAVALAVAALWIRFELSQRKNLSNGQSVVLAGIVMGCAISGMHYTAMDASKYVGLAESGFNASTNNTTILALTIAFVTLCISVLAAAVNALLHYKQLLLDQQTSETRLQAIVATAVDGIITFNADGEILEFNHAAEKIFGWQAVEAIGQRIHTLAPGLRVSQDQDANTGSVREWTGYFKNGRPFPIRLAIGRALLETETLFIAVVTDISTGKKMEQDLRDSELKFRSLIGNIPGVTFRSALTNDKQIRLEFMSESVERITGWSAADFLSGAVKGRTIIHPDDYERVRATIGTAIRGTHNYTLEYRIVNRWGQERWLSETATAMADPLTGRKWIDGVLLDVTESKLRNAEFEGIVDAIRRSLNVVEFDLDGHILSVNDRFLRLSGYSAEELIGQHHSILCFPEDVAQPSYEGLWTDLRDGQFVTGDFRRRGKSGKDIWIHGTYNPILDSNGKPQRVIKFATDLSERRAMEMDLRLSKEKAEQAAIAKSTFLANMSHEIRTPMNAIIGFTEVLLETHLSEDQRRHLTTVSRSARSLLALLNDILDTAKLEHGSVELEVHDFSLRDICQELLATLRLTAERRGLALQLDYAAEVGTYFQGDALRIQQILLNLLGNAIKFTHQGSVTLAVKERSNGVEISVIDTGIGIAADRLDRIFEPFAQADASMTRRFGGTGLGTTIARQFAELMGGHIGVESTLGGGSRFWVQLPLAAGQEPPQAASSQTLRLPPLRLLIADDVPQNLELLELRLGPLGHQITKAANGLEAVQHATRAPFDVVLMDVQMPEMDGLAATQAIRQHEAKTGAKPVPIIALTASVLEEDRYATEAAGMSGFAVKPIDIDKLLLEIARVIGHTDLEGAKTAEPQHDDADVNWQQGIELWGDRETLSFQIGKFVHETAAQLPRWQENPADCRSNVHRIRGVAGNLALPQVHKLATALEAAAKAGPVSAAQWQTLAAAIARLQGRFPRAEENAQETAVHTADGSQENRHESVEGTAGMPVPVPQLTAWLAQLRRGALADDLAQQVYSQLPVSTCNALKNAINDFDLDAAIALVEGLLSTDPRA